MNDIPKGKSLKRCIELCRKQLSDVKAEVADIEREEEETDLEKLDAILKAVERICIEGENENRVPVKTLNDKFIHLMGGIL